MAGALYGVVKQGKRVCVRETRCPSILGLAHSLDFSLRGLRRQWKALRMSKVARESYNRIHISSVCMTHSLRSMFFFLKHHLVNNPYSDHLINVANTHPLLLSFSLHFQSPFTCFAFLFHNACQFQTHRVIFWFVSLMCIVCLLYDYVVHKDRDLCPNDLCPKNLEWQPPHNRHSINTLKE